MTKKWKPFTPTPSQRTFLEYVLDEDNEVITFCGGRGGGKSLCGAAACALLIYQTKRCKQGIGWVICPDYGQAKAAAESIKKTFGWASEGGNIIDHKINDNTFIIGRNGDLPPYKIEIKTANNPIALRGRQVDFLWFDEAAHLEGTIGPDGPAEPESWTASLPTLSESGGPIICTTTPLGKNWFYKYVYMQSEINDAYKVVRSTSHDNPFLSKKYVKGLTAKLSGKSYQQEVMAEFITMDGLIYNYEPNLHNFELDPLMSCLPNGMMVAGVDFGHDDPFVHLWVWRGLDGSFWVLDEHYQRRTTTDVHASTIRGNPFSPKVVRRWADPSAAQGRADLERMRVGTYQAVNDQKLGINLLARLLDQRKLHINAKKCPNLVREIQNYEWAKLGDKPKPHQEDHALDALRYVVASEDWMGTGGSNPVSYTQDDGTVIVDEGDGGGLYPHLPSQAEPDAEGTYGWSIDGIEST